MLEGLLPSDVRARFGDPRAEMARLLPDEERLVASAVAKRRHEFSHGRALARALLAEFGVPEAPLLSGPQREPLWPSGLVGSVTHTDGLCVVAVAESERYAGIGVDVEPDAPLEDALAARICLPEERVRLAAQDFCEPAVATRLVFSAKEAVYKCQFYLTRRFLWFPDVEIWLEPAGDFRVRILAEVTELGDGARFVGRWARRGGFLLTAVWLARDAG
jgi:4'-phosphopantetheinyl transferase EntD